MSKCQIFISYRRNNGDYIAGRIADRLNMLGYNVFYDTDSMLSGRFDNQIYKAIESCNDFLLILSQGALDRCLDEKDWVRKEIAYALKLEKNVIPITDCDFQFPQNLPDEIKGIEFEQGVNIPKGYFDAAFDRIRKYLQSVPCDKSFSNVKSEPKADNGENKSTHDEKSHVVSNRDSFASDSNNQSEDTIVAEKDSPTFVYTKTKISHPKAEAIQNNNFTIPKAEPLPKKDSFGDNGVNAEKKEAEKVTNSKQKYAFISYATKNQRFADELREFFAKNRIKTWMAPYDVPAYREMSGAIARAIRSCDCFVFCLTNEYQSSKSMIKEVQSALSAKRPIVPVMVENIKLINEMEFIVGNIQAAVISDFSENSTEAENLLTRVAGYTGVMEN